ncbi:unnamed protein product, partial [Staurois parvus]
WALVGGTTGHRWAHCWVAQVGALLGTGGCTARHWWMALLGTGGRTAGHRWVHCKAQVGGTCVCGTEGHRSSGH